MAHFDRKFTKFLRELSKNNNRDWFNANKPRFISDVKEPFEAFMEYMIDKIGAIDKRVMLPVKDCVFRIYKDTRFSKDKTPYKTHMAGIISPGGRKDMSRPGIYLQMNHEDVRIYSGLYKPEKKQLDAVRDTIAANPKQFKKLISAKKFKDTFGEIHGEKNKRLPKELVEAAEEQPLLYNKQFYYFEKHKPSVMYEDNFPKLIINSFKAARPLNEFWEEATH